MASKPQTRGDEERAVAQPGIEGRFYGGAEQKKPGGPRKPLSVPDMV